MDDNEKKWRQVSPAFDTTREAYDHITPTDTNGYQSVGTPHTPTDDEREAAQDSERLRQLAESLAMDTGQGEVAARLNAIADRIDRMVPIADLEAAWRVGARHASRADAAEKALAERSESQGEPSDAQVLAEPSAQELLDYIFDPEEDDMSGSIRYGLIFEMLTDLRAKRAAGVGGAR